VSHPNNLKDVCVRLTYTDIKDIAKNHARTLADLFSPLPISLVATSPHRFAAAAGAAIIGKGATATTKSSRHASSTSRCAAP
jgi:hypothetical protein